MDPSRRKILLYIAGALLLVAVALLAVTCSLLQQQDEPETPSVETVPKPPDLGLPDSGLITITPDATATPQSGEQSGASSSSAGFSAAEAAALEAELSAMEKALDSMDMPGDGDFKDIESGLK